MVGAMIYNNMAISSIPKIKDECSVSQDYATPSGNMHLMQKMKEVKKIILHFFF